MSFSRYYKSLLSPIASHRAGNLDTEDEQCRWLSRHFYPWRRISPSPFVHKTARDHQKIWSAKETGMCHLKWSTGACSLMKTGIVLLGYESNRLVTSQRVNLPSAMVSSSNLARNLATCTCCPLCRLRLCFRHLGLQAGRGGLSVNVGNSS